MKSCLTSHLEVTKNFCFPLRFPRGQEKLPRSSSIDSMVDMVWNNDCETNLVTLPKHLMVQETSNRRESLLSPRRTKASRGINCEYDAKVKTEKSKRRKMGKIAYIDLASSTRTVAHFYKLLTHDEFKDKRNIRMNI